MPPRRAHLVLVMAAVAAGWFSAPAPADAQVQIGLNFTGARLRYDSNLYPPNSMLAAGPTSVVEFINGRYSVFSKTDGSLLQTSGLNDFWVDAGCGYAGRYAYDPRILYDPFTQRWYASCLDGNMMVNATGESHFLLAVSKTSDPTQGWTGFAIDTDPTHTQWGDYDMLGVNRDSLVLTCNMYGIGDANYPLTGQTVLVVPKAGLVASTPSIAGLIRFDHAAANICSQPVVDLDNRALPTSLWSSTVLFGNLARRNILGPLSSPTISGVTYLSVDPYVDPPDAPQPNKAAKLETYDSRLSSSVVLKDGVLWGTHAVKEGSQAAVWWFKVDEGNNIVMQQGLITSDTLSYYYPSIAVNDYGDVVIGFSGSGTSTYVSAFAAVGRTVDGLTIFDDPMLLKAGTETFEIIDSSGRNRGGDYSATVVDPNDPYTFWTIQEVVLAHNEWDTQIIQITVPEPCTMAVLLLGAVGALVRRRRGARPSQPCVSRASRPRAGGPGQPRA